MRGEEEIVNAVIGLAQILVLIPVSITTGLSVSIIPNITKSFVQNNFGLLKEQMGQSLLILTFIIMPASFGIFVLAEPLYQLLLAGNSPVLGGQILKVYAPAAILIAFYGITTSILQAINQQKKLIIGLFIGIIIKVILNFALPSIFLEKGFILATYFGYFTSLTFNILIIQRTIGLKRLKIKYRLVSILVSALIMAISVYFLKEFLEEFAGTFLIVMICSSLGILLYILSLYGINFFRFRNFLKGK
ncbi:polysaccharide biosynthesis C-terminal domain-containing protein [Cytobacillus praedii]|uniref:lipid II flippase MurJ n=1 Tax=Cytobacillus praedii TaxID=1742358 RepID=UPI0013F48453|nr:polysaccharide biosynthesis C-terminal domain-containing protein [Cytobacillus praedii]